MTPYPNAPGHVAGSDTSEAAADSVEDTAASMRARVLWAIERRGAYGTTDDELEVLLGMRHQTVSARRRELELLDAIHKTTERRKTRSGRTAAVVAAGTASRSRTTTTSSSDHTDRPGSTPGRLPRAGANGGRFKSCWRLRAITRGETQGAQWHGRPAR